MVIVDRTNDAPSSGTTHHAIKVGHAAGGLMNAGQGITSPGGISRIPANVDQNVADVDQVPRTTIKIP
jgi:hypothetical protein